MELISGHRHAEDGGERKDQRQVNGQKSFHVRFLAGVVAFSGGEGEPTVAGWVKGYVRLSYAATQVRRWQSRCRCAGS